MGAFGSAKQGLSACFVNQSAVAANVKERLGLLKAVLPSRGTRTQQVSYAAQRRVSGDPG